MDFSEIYDAAPSTVRKIVVDYSGSGDEGYINDIFVHPLKDDIVLPHDLVTKIHDLAYDILENHHPGWEINEGSTGTITFDIVARAATLHHGVVVESHEWIDTDL